MSDAASDNNPEKKAGKFNNSIVSRRAFLGISGGAAAALAGFLTFKLPGFDFSPSVDSLAKGVIGTPLEISSSCLNCPTRCAIKVRVVNGKAVRIVGNTNSTYSYGKTCPRSHVGLQVLYNPERITRPLKRRQGVSKGKNEDLSWEDQWEEITWEEALSAVEERLSGLDSGQLLILQGLNTTSDEDLISRFAKSFGTPGVFREDTLEREADNKGKELANISPNTGYDLENANYILSFGADIIEGEAPLARNLRLWGKIRRERPNKARIVVVDPRYSVTASRADEWIPINPGTEGALAMAIAHVIISRNLYNEDFITSHTSGFSSYRNLVLKSYSPDTVAGITGISAGTIERIAEEFARSAPAIAWSGSGATSWPHGSETSHAVLCLNALAGSIDVPGGIIYQELPEYADMPEITGDDPAVLGLAEVKDRLSDTDTIIGFNNNLIMSVPDTKTWDADLAGAGYYIHIASAKTEMAQYADIILPSLTYLEEWAYESAPPGSGYAEAKIKQPAVVPEDENISKPTSQIIFDLVDRLGGSVASRFDKAGIVNSTGVGSDPEGFVKFRTAGFVAWNDFKDAGVWRGADYEYGKYDEVFETDTKRFVFDSSSLSANTLNSVSFKGSSSEESLVLKVYHPVMDIRNGNQNYPWPQEIFLVMHGYGWNNFVEMNERDADERGIGDGDMVWVESESGSGTRKRSRVKARVFEGIIPGTVSVALGQGHYACGEWADGIGMNPKDIICTDYDEKSGQPSFNNTRVIVYK